MEESKSAADKQAVEVYCRTKYEPSSEELKLYETKADVPLDAKPAGSEQKNSDTSDVNANSAPPPVEKYAAKYPWDKVQGYVFMEHPDIRAAVQKVVKNSSIRKSISTRNAVSSGISLSPGFLTYTGCEPHNCGDHNWKVVYYISEKRAEVCYYNFNESELTGSYPVGYSNEVVSGC